MPCTHDKRRGYEPWPVRRIDHLALRPADLVSKKGRGQDTHGKHSSAVAEDSSRGSSVLGRGRSGGGAVGARGAGAGGRGATRGGGARRAARADDGLVGVEGAALGLDVVGAVFLALGVVRIGLDALGEGLLAGELCGGKCRSQYQVDAYAYVELAGPKGGEEGRTGAWKLTVYMV